VKCLGIDEDAESKPPQLAYLYLLATTLTEHEKNLDKHIKRLVKVSRNLSKIAVEEKPKEATIVRKVSVKETGPETIVYMRLRVNRPTDELTLILESLKE